MYFGPNNCTRLGNSKKAQNENSFQQFNHVLPFLSSYLHFAKEELVRSEQVSVNTYVHVCMYFTYASKLLAIFANGSSNSRWWRRKHLKKEANFTEKWGENFKWYWNMKNALPKDSSRAPISDGQGNVFQGMVSEKKGKKLGWIMLKI